MVDFIAYAFPIILVAVGIILFFLLIALLGFLVITAVMRIWMDSQDDVG
ncbi:hypothetical protein [Eisenbergiella sp.]